MTAKAYCENDVKTPSNSVSRLLPRRKRRGYASETCVDVAENVQQLRTRFRVFYFSCSAAVDHSS